MGKVYTKLRVLCILGAALSAYAIYINCNAKHNANYKALCDISPHVRCTNIFDPWVEKGFGFLNDVFGADSILTQPNDVLVFIPYMLMFQSTFIFSVFAMSPIQFLLSFVSHLMSNCLLLICALMHKFSLVYAANALVNFGCIWQSWHIFNKQWFEEPEKQEHETAQLTQI